MAKECNGMSHIFLSISVHTRTHTHHLIVQFCLLCHHSHCCRMCIPQSFRVIFWRGRDHDFAWQPYRNLERVKSYRCCCCWIYFPTLSPPAPVPRWLKSKGPLIIHTHTFKRGNVWRAKAYFLLMQSAPKHTTFHSYSFQIWNGSINAIK